MTYARILPLNQKALGHSRESSSSGLAPEERSCAAKVVGDIVGGGPQP